MSSALDEKPFRLDRKVAVITGGGSGIGKAIAQRFAASGAGVWILEQDEQKGKEVAREISSRQGSATSIVCDVSDWKQVNEAFREITRKSPVNILINNAGVSHIGSLEKTTEADFDRIFRINVKGIYNCMLACVDGMKQTGGVMLNMASVAGSAGLADRFAYSASKGAVIAMTYSVARDYLPYGIRCVCISPGRVHTPFVDDYLRRNYPGRETEMFEKLSKTQPIGRMGQPHEIADLALFLCSDQAAFITGVDYPIDGGFFNLHG
jgi:2-keto-3-deoxy-L-fuconate dehydrogenase